MAINLSTLDMLDAYLVQTGLQKHGFYGSTLDGEAGPITQSAYQRYRSTFRLPTDPESPPTTAPLTYPAYVKKEQNYLGNLKRGNRGKRVERLQEWLTLHGFKTTVDGDFGPATLRTMNNFQRARGMNKSTALNKATWNVLIEPLNRVLAPALKGESYSQTVKNVASQHLLEHPQEVGGPNAGPWVRLYMSGHEGPHQAWCAGFVRFILKQAAKIHGTNVPVAGSVSCDTLAAQGKEKSRFVSEANLRASPSKWNKATLGDCCIFLVRRTSTDWTHTGFAFNYDSDTTFSTIEGNTNDDGSREGYEACTRTRSRSKIDFIQLD